MLVAEFYRRAATEPADGAVPPPQHGGEPAPPPPPPDILGRARWSGGRPEFAADDPDVETTLRRIFRPTSVAVDDPASRSQGSSGPSVLTPGSHDWFRWAAINRGAEEDLAVRFVPEGMVGGWDPAANYRTFKQQVKRLVTWRA